MRIVDVIDPGATDAGPEALTVREAADPPAGAGELLVDVAAAGVNRADLLQRRGRYPAPPGAPRWPGLEVSGVVAGVGDGVAGWAVGDRVAALLAGGGYAERVAVRAALALRVPDDLDLVDAAALPEALATVWSNLEVAHARAGDWLLVRGGSGGVGSVAVQLARALGLRVVATAGGPQRVARVAALGADVAIDHRLDGPADRLVRAVRDATGGHGVDVVLDVLGAGGLDAHLRMLADDGRLVVIGLQQGSRGELDLGLLLSRRASVVGTMLRGRPFEQKAAIVAGVREHAWPLVTGGRVRPVVHARVPLTDAPQAHRLLESGEVFGKVLLVP